MPYRKKTDPFVPRTRWVDFEGQRIKVYSIGYLAHMTQRTPKRLNDWMKMKVLPRPIIDLGDPFSWWTAAELIGYTTIVRHGNIRPQFRSLFALKDQTWAFRRILRRRYLMRPDRVKKTLGKNFDWREILYRKREVEFQKEAQKLLKLIPPRKQTPADDPAYIRRVQLENARKMLAARGLGFLKGRKHPQPEDITANTKRNPKNWHEEPVD